MPFLYVQITVDNNSKEFYWMCVCVCVCVCVCLFILFHRRGFYRLQWCHGHTWDARINDLVLWVLYQVLLPSSFISVSKNVIFLSKDETSAANKLDRKRYDILLQWKMIYIDIVYKLALIQNRQVAKRY